MKSSHFYSRNSLELSLIAALIGVLVAIGVLAFKYILNVLSNLIFHLKFDFDFTSPTTHSYGIWVIGLPVLGIILSAIVVKRFAPDAKGHGLTEIIEAVMAHGGRVRKKVVLVNFFASIITIVFGATVGKTGPAVQFAALIGSVVAKFFKLHAKYMRIFVGCGAAAAISVLFNAPIAAVIFGMELIVADFRAKSFILFAISSICATVVYRMHLGATLAFIPPQYLMVNPMEWGFYIVLGVVGGIAGILIIKSIYGMEDLFNFFPESIIGKALVGGLIVGGTAYFYPDILGVGYEVVDVVLQGQLTLQTMLILLVLKTVMLGFVLATGGCGGVIAPSLYIGAMVGGAFGLIMEYFVPGGVAPYSSYALLGMAAVFSATNRATFTAIALIFEMTLDYSIVLPLMIVCVVADQISAWILHNQTIYTLKLKRKGIKIIDNFSVDLFSKTRVKDVMETDIHMISVDMTLEKARELVADTNHIIYPVLDGQGVFVGVLRSKEIMHESKSLDPKTKVGDLIVGIPSAVFPNDTIVDAVMKYHSNRDPRIYVVDPNSKKFLGMISPHCFEDH